MSTECRYICQRAANAIISEVGSYQVSSGALLGINQFIDEFLIQLLADCQSLDLSRIKASVFRLVPSTLGKNAIVEAELEVKTFTQVEPIDYDVYERMRTLGQSQPFPMKKCLPYLRDKCFGYCTLADKEDQQLWPSQRECQDLIISPIVAIYVTTVLEHLTEYILMTVALTAEIEETEIVRIKDLFLTLVDDLQVGLVFQSMDLRSKMEKQCFGARSTRFPRSSTPSFQDRLRGSSYSMALSNSYFGELPFDESEVHSSNRPGAHACIANDPAETNDSRHSASTMTKNISSDGASSTTPSSNSKKAFKVFKNDYEDGNNLLSFDPSLSSVYGPDSSSANFDDLIRSGNTMRVSLTPKRLKSIEVKDQMVDDGPKPTNSAWKRRSSSVPRMSASAYVTKSPTPTPSPLPLPLMQPPLIETGIGNGYAATLSDADLKHHTSAQRRQSKSKVSKAPHSKPASKVPPSIERTLPTPTSSTSSTRLKARPTTPPPSSSLSLKTSDIVAALDQSTLDSAPLTCLASDHTAPAAFATPTISTESTFEASSKPVLLSGDSGSRKSRENLQSQRGKGDESPTQQKGRRTTRTNLAAPVIDTDIKTESSAIDEELDPSQQPSENHHHDHHQDQQRKASVIHADLIICQTPTILSSGTDAPTKPESNQANTSPCGTSPLQPSDADDDRDDSKTATTTQICLTTSKRITSAGTVGSTIKQLDQAMKQKTSSTSFGVDAKDDPSTTTSNRQHPLTSPTALQQKTASRRSAVLDKVLQFERAYSMDDMAQRRASSYIPRRERFMYLQHDTNKPNATTATKASYGHHRVSVSIMAAAARFEAGKSVAIQTDDNKRTAPMVTKKTHFGRSTPFATEEEWFLPDAEKSQEQESEVVTWLLGEA